VVQRLPAGLYPYGVVAGDSSVYLSPWAGQAVRRYVRRGNMLVAAGEIPVARHPSALLLSPDGSRLYAASASADAISVIDTRAGSVVATLHDAAPAGPAEGSTPNGLALSSDGSRLFVAEADNNAVAIFDLASNALEGRIPVEWYPTAVLAFGDTVLSLNGKGRGTAPNPAGPGPGRPRSDPRDYTLGQTTGSITTVSLAGADLAALSTRVAVANGWNTRPAAAATFPPFTHVIYIIKENRTYDQVLGDLPDGDGDSTLTYFPRSVAPNHHALAERFGIFDRFFVNAEVSADGHNWSTAAWGPDYVEKTVPSNYSGRGRGYDYEGENRGVDVDDEDDVDSPSTGYLWDAAVRAGISLRNYGEYTVRDTAGRWVATKDALALHTDPDAPGWDLDVPDQARADAWLAEFRGFVAADTMPALTILRLPNDHTAGASAGAPTPRAYMADNDLALGRVIEALSHSPFWTNTVVFVLEDDAQNGPDHVDSHRSPLLVVSAYNRGGVISRFANTTDVLATIGAILHLEPLSQFDYYGRPLADIFATSADTAPYTALTPDVPLDETNPKRTALATLSRRLDFSAEDRADDALFNRVLWQAIKGETPYPGSRRIPVLEVQRAR
jgi:YVTN family beta-propeller protein